MFSCEYCKKNFRTEFIEHRRFEFTKSLLTGFARARARVCVCVCVCVCVFIFFHRKVFFRLQDVQDKFERLRSTILCCEYLSGCFCQVPSSPYPKMSYFTFKDENSSLEHTGEKAKRYNVLRER